MRKILIFLIVASLILGAASAVPRWGPPNGFYTKYLDADTITADVITSGVNITEDGSIGTDVTFAADKYLKAATGTGYVDWSAATGVFKGPTGVFTPGGDISIPSSQAFNMGDGGATFGGLVTAANLKVNGTVYNVGALTTNAHFTGATGKFNTSLYSAGTLKSAGTATLNALKINTTTYSVGALTSNALVTGANAKVNGTTYSVGALTTNSLLTAANGKINGTLYTVGTVTGNGQVTGATIKANTSIYSAGTLNSAGTATLNAVTVNGTATLNGAVYYKCNATTSISTTLTATDVATVYPVDASAGHVTLTLPDPTTVDGRMYVISTLVDMGSNNVIVATTGAGKIGGVGGADTLTTTDITAALTVISDGTHYVTIGRIGTWT